MSNGNNVGQNYRNKDLPPLQKYHHPQPSLLIYLIERHTSPYMGTLLNNPFPVSSLIWSGNHSRNWDIWWTAQSCWWAAIWLQLQVLWEDIVSGDPCLCYLPQSFCCHCLWIRHSSIHFLIIWPTLSASLSTLAFLVTEQTLRWLAQQ